MKLHFFLLLLLSLLHQSIAAQKMSPYTIYNSKGKKISYRKAVKMLDDSDVILFGEIHNNAIAHWLQLKLTKELHQKRPLILGAEMIEADNQQALNDYLAGKTDYQGLDAAARLWSNYPTDYAPIVDFAKANNLPFIGTNIPRRYASQVYRAGGFSALDGLSTEEKGWIAPLPIRFDPELPQYQNMLTMMGDHGTPEIVMAQAIKDATMAHFILANYREGHTFLHLNGAYHSDFYEGILWYLRQQNTDLRYTTITTVEQADINQFDAENRNRADIIICVDSEMTKTY